MVPVIEVKGLSKSYEIGHGGAGGYKRLSESMTGFAVHPLRTVREWRSEKEVFWAVKDVSFEVTKGEVVGIIGRNGAGKSTVLKIISRITYPTTGRIDLRGRVGSLLEVGTGFHPELTGRENIYMCGAILGMKKKEIDGNFDDIVRFAEIEKFLDTPVKRYSSGMYVRLGFAVAAHLRPEILLVDEVLAVGDAQFQKKCLGKIQDVSEGGKTVLFVSHNMPVVEGLCEKAILVDEGRMKAMGDARDVVSEYLKVLNTYKGSDLSDPSLKRTGNGTARFTWIEVLTLDGGTLQAVTQRMPFRVSVKLKVESTIEVKDLGLTVVDRLGRNVLSTSLADNRSNIRLDRGTHTLSVFVDPNPFLKGNYTIKLFCRGKEFQDYDMIDYAYNLVVVPNIEFEQAKSAKRGAVHLPYEWSIDRPD